MLFTKMSLMDFSLAQCLNKFLKNMFCSILTNFIMFGNRSSSFKFFSFFFYKLIKIIFLIINKKRKCGYIFDKILEQFIFFILRTCHGQLVFHDFKVNTRCILPKVKLLIQKCLFFTVGRQLIGHEIKFVVRFITIIRRFLTQLSGM